MKIKIPVLIFLCLFTAINAFAEKMPIAIMDMEAIDVPVNTARAVSDLIRTELFNTGLFRVFERGEMEKIIKEQQFGQSGLSDVEYAVKVGKLLSAKKICVGTVSKLGTSFIVNARIIDVERGEMEFADKAKSETETDLDKAVETFARRIAGRIQAQSGGTTYNAAQQQNEPVKTTSQKPVKEKEQVSSSSGSGQHKLLVPSLIIIGAGAITGGLSFLFNGQVKTTYDIYSALIPGSSDFDSKWQDVLAAQKKRDIFMWSGIGLGGIGLTLLTIDLISSGSRKSAMKDSGISTYIAFNGSGYNLEWSRTW